MASSFPMKKNTGTRIVFPILDADGDPVTGAAGLDSEVSLDGGGFSDLSNEAIEMATNSGIYYLDLLAAETNADCVAIQIKTSTSGAKTTLLVFYTSAVLLDTLADLPASIYLDIDNGIAGTAYPIGTPGTPVSNYADAFTICAARDIYSIQLVGLMTGIVTLPANVTIWLIFKGESKVLSSIDLNNKTLIADTTFKDLYLYGITPSGIRAENCWIGTLTMGGATGHFADCILEAVFTTSRAVGFFNCYFLGGVIDLTGSTGKAIYYIGASGRLEIRNLTAASTVYIYGNGLELVIVSSCTAGTINIYGDVKVTDSSSSTVNDYTVNTKASNLPSGVQKNVALSNFTFFMLLSDHVTPATGKTIVSEISKDGGAFSGCSNSAAEVGSGTYKIDLTQAEMNATVITLKFTEVTCDPTMVTIVTSR